MEPTEALQLLVVPDIPLLEGDGGMAAGDRVSGKALADDASRLDDAALPYGDPSQDDHVVAEPYVAPDDDVLVDHAVAVGDGVVMVVVMEGGDDLAPRARMKIGPDGDLSPSRHRHAVEVDVVGKMRVGSHVGFPARVDATLARCRRSSDLAGIIELNEFLPQNAQAH